MGTINVTEKTRNEFNKELINLRGSEKRTIFADEFLERLLKHWRGQDG